jgi:hypothetical protein
VLGVRAAQDQLLHNRLVPVAGGHEERGGAVVGLRVEADAGGDQRLCAGGVTAHRGHEDRRAAVLGRGVDLLRASLQQGLQAVGVAVAGGDVQRGQLVAVLGRRRRLLAEQLGDHGRLALLRGKEERRAPHGVGAVQLGPGRQKHVDDVAVTVAAGAEHGGAAARSPQVFVGAALEQRVDDGEVALLTRDVQGGVAVLDQPLIFGAGFEQRLDDRGGAEAAGVEKRRAAVARLHFGLGLGREESLHALEVPAVAREVERSCQVLSHHFRSLSMRTSVALATHAGRTGRAHIVLALAARRTFTTAV